VRWIGPLILAIAAGSCGETSNEPSRAKTEDATADDLAIEVRCAVEETPLGRAFDLAVVRTWSRDFAPAPFRAETLLPVVFVPESTAKTELRDHVSEAIRGRGYVFSLDDVEDARASFDARPRSGGPVRTVRSNPISLRTTPALTADDKLDAESPGDLHAMPPRRGAVLAAATLLLAIVALAVRTGRARAARLREARPPRATAAERLARLRDGSPRTPAAWEAFHVAVSDAVRDHLEDRHAVPAPRMTTEELARSADAAARCGDRLEDGVALLASCDAVKFAQERADADAESVAAGRLAAAERLVSGDGR